MAGSHNLTVPDLEGRDLCGGGELPDHGLDDTRRALELVHGARQSRYGHPRENFRRIGVIWQAVLDLDAPVPPEKVALCLAGMKLARLIHDPHDADGQLDISGYVETLRMLG